MQDQVRPHLAKPFAQLCHQPNGVYTIPHTREILLECGTRGCGPSAVDAQPGATYTPPRATGPRILTIDGLLALRRDNRAGSGQHEIAISCLTARDAEIWLTVPPNPNRAQRVRLQGHCGSGHRAHRNKHAWSPGEGGGSDARSTSARGQCSDQPMIVERHRSTDVVSRSSVK